MLYFKRTAHEKAKSASSRRRYFPILSGILLAAALLFADGCGTETGSAPSTSAPQDMTAELQVVTAVDEAQTLLAKGDSNAALAVIEAALAEQPESQVLLRKKDSILKLSGSAPSGIPRITMSAVQNIYESSALYEPDYGFIHGAANLIDGDPATAWVDGIESSGVGESVELRFDGEYLVSGVKLCNGYQKNADIFEKNERVQVIRFTFSDGSIYECDLEDALGEQVIDFGEEYKTSSLTLSIVSVYPGTKYTDTAISELSLY